MNIKYSPLYAESWNVAYRFKSVGSILSDKVTKFCVIPNSKRYWAADPMTFEYEGSIYIFAELYDYTLCRGTIGYTRLEENGFGKWRQIIVEDFHMSYPFVFIKDDDVYMVPETSEANELIMYKAVSFPDQWVKYKTIKTQVKWVDTTFWETNENVIAFTESITQPYKDYKLCLNKDYTLMSEELLNTNDNTFRCGGRIFKYKDRLIRVCQDCNEKYGGALFFRLCDNENFIENSVMHITPDELSYDKKILLDGMHTYTALNNMEVIDIKTRRLNLINMFFRTLNKMRKSNVNYQVVKK